MESYLGILTGHWQTPHIPQSRDCNLCSAVPILKHNAIITGLDSLRLQALRHGGIKFSFLETVKCFLYLII